MLKRVRQRREHAANGLGQGGSLFLEIPDLVEPASICSSSGDSLPNPVSHSAFCTTTGRPAEAMAWKCRSNCGPEAFLITGAMAITASAPARAAASASVTDSFVVQ